MKEIICDKACQRILIKAFVIMALALIVKANITYAAPFAYVTSPGKNINIGTVFVIDTKTNNLTTMVEIEGYPGKVAATPDGTKIYVTDSSIGSTTVSVINTETNTRSATVDVGGSSCGVAINPTGTRAYVAIRDSNTVSVISTATNSVIDTLNVGTDLGQWLSIQMERNLCHDRRSNTTSYKRHNKY